MRFLLFLALFSSSSLFGASNSEKKHENWPKVAKHVKKGLDYDFVLAHEGEFIITFNKELEPYIKEKLSKKSLKEILRKNLEAHLNIPLNKKGFVQAAHP